jgi:hypothetical protein
MNWYCYLASGLIELAVCASADAWAGRYGSSFVRKKKRIVAEPNLILGGHKNSHVRWTISFS